MNDPGSVRVTVEIVLEQNGIAGTLQEPDGRRAPFAGWIGLISALESRRAAGHDPAEGDPR
jgi:hypothetical protein